MGMGESSDRSLCFLGSLLFSLSTMHRKLDEEMANGMAYDGNGVKEG